MLQNPHFYHQLTRKAVVLFGRLFDDLMIVRKNNTDGKEFNRFLVPLVYSPKEKMVTRTLSDPDLLKQIQVILPRMGFEITGITYDPTRKQNSLLKAAKSNTTSHVSSMYMGVPYDINFSLNVYARNIDDGTHIVEQILPFFNPDFTVTTNMVPDLGLLKDTPIILNNISQNIEYEGNYDSVRYVYWTLNFTMKMYYYGPVTYPKIIRTVYANIYNDTSLQSGYITRLNVVSADGNFKMDDMVFQGDSYSRASAYGIVVSYSSNNGKLTLGAVQGQFKVNNVIHAVSTKAYATIDSFQVDPMKLAAIRVTPDPIDAQPEDDYGYNTDIIEWPMTDIGFSIVNTSFDADSLTIHTANTTITADSTE